MEALTNSLQHIKIKQELSSYIRNVQSLSKQLLPHLTHSVNVLLYCSIKQFQTKD